MRHTGIKVSKGIEKCIVEVTRREVLIVGDKILYSDQLLEIIGFQHEWVQTEDKILLCKNLTADDGRTFTIEIKPFYNKIITTKVDDIIEYLEECDELVAKEVRGNVALALVLLKGEGG